MVVDFITVDGHSQSKRLREQLLILVIYFLLGKNNSF